MTSVARQQTVDKAPVESISERDFKATLRTMAATVCVVTARHGDMVSGMTATAVCSVSAEPPSVLVVVNRVNRSHATISGSGCFALHLLSTHQSGLATHFASRPEQPFAHVANRPGLLDCPVIDDCAAVMECLVEASQEFGTHTIFIGRVVATQHADVDPLIYSAGQYRSINRL